MREITISLIVNVFYEKKNTVVLVKTIEEKATADAIL
jgi:hypothetical protein